PHTFEAGDEVLIIQMQGATINESNSSHFGDIESLGRAGFFEKNEIAAVNGNEVLLKYLLVNDFDPSGSVQLVSFPKYPAAVVTDTLRAAPWDGHTGGIIALEVTGVLELQAPVDVSNRGFRGGATHTVSSDCNFFTNADDYHYSMDNWRGAPKGEGIAAVIPGKEQGRGPQANGGGGGNDHNSGGGGGANISPAGEGGKTSVSGFGCSGNFPGERGKPLPADTLRWFMGGGGGAGHDNNGTASPGGNGGGLIIIMAGVLTANGQKIMANGQSAATGAGDGAGGGGAGGTIVLAIDQLDGPLVVEARGGNGGDQNNPSDRCIGTGGGGSGGRLVANISNGITAHLDGGNPGINLNPSSQCSSDPSNSADGGANGEQTPFAGIPFSALQPMPFSILAQPADTNVCENTLARFQFSLTGNYLQYQWQMNDGTGWADIAPGGVFSGTTTPLLQISSVTPDMDGFRFRCLTTGPCSSDLLSVEAWLSVQVGPQAGFSSAFLGNNTFQFDNSSTNAISYLWDFGDGNTSTTANPQHTYMQGGLYQVTLTAINACGEMSTTQTVDVQSLPQAGFTVSEDTGCAPFSVQFFNNSSANAESVEWHFPGGNPPFSISDAPQVVYGQPGQYEVILIAINPEGADTLTVADAITVLGLPDANFNATVNGQDVEFANLSIGASGGFEWDFGDGTTSNEVSPVHTYQSAGQYEVTLTAVNACGETTFTQTVSVGGFPQAAFTATFNNPCAPLTVQFTDQSSGSNLLAWSWVFEGGNPATSSVQNPVVTYTQPGVYDVQLTVFNSLGEHTIVLEDFVDVPATPVADFDFEIHTDTVLFFSMSTGADFWLWDFGDGHTSTEMNPVHIYEQGGVFQVTLTVGNASCGSAISREVFIDLPSATTEPGRLASVLVFPNPFADSFYIYFGEKMPARTRLTITGADGRTRMEKLLSTNTTHIETGNMPPGLYFIKIHSPIRCTVFKMIKH
ncbi:MAG TPA: PKD domain-containing protein, partial [Bacteroidetes bacterium]|nr:PKD domain-containing protein [Bacteroidota bacterium]